METAHADAMVQAGIQRQSVGDMTLTTVETTLQQDVMLRGASEAHLSLILVVEGAGHYVLEGDPLRTFQPGSLLVSCSQSPCQGEDFFPRHCFYDLCIIDYPVRYIQALIDAGIMLVDQPSAIFSTAIPSELKLLRQQIQQASRNHSPLGALRLESLLLQALWLSVCELQLQQTLPSRSVPLFARDRQKLIKAREYIRQQQQEPLNLDAVAKASGLTPILLKRGFRVMFGITPWNFVIQCRLERAQKLLVETAMSLDDIAVQCGFSHASHLSRFFQRQHGLSPGRYRRQQASE